MSRAYDFIRAIVTFSLACSAEVIPLQCEQIRRTPVLDLSATTRFSLDVWHVVLRWFAAVIPGGYAHAKLAPSERSFSPAPAGTLGVEVVRGPRLEPFLGSRRLTLNLWTEFAGAIFWLFGRPLRCDYGNYDDGTLVRCFYHLAYSCWHVAAINTLLLSLLAPRGQELPLIFFLLAPASFCH